MKRLGFIIVVLLVSGCASQSAPESKFAGNAGTLGELKAEAQQQAIATCQKDAMHAYPNVSIFTIWDACHHAVTGRPTMTQRVNRF